MKKTILLTCTLLINIYIVKAQVKIGANTPPAASSILELESTNRGFLPPRINLTSPTMALNGVTPTDGMVVFNTNTSSGLGGLCTWHHNQWNKIIDSRTTGTLTSFVILKGASQSLPGLQTTRLNYESIIKSQSSGSDAPMFTSGNAITIRRSGVYCITANLQIQVTNSGSGIVERYLVIEKNTVQMAASSSYNNQNQVLNASTTVYCSAGDVIRVCYTSGASVLAVSSPFSWCAVAQMPASEFE
ncbi:hypothetical protein [Pedobacter sp. KLB.chiD]|uniref:hypothetical protein n=1 Tax=Pedobacter sp. KLB.chiD TaxID=3387402 RepID=UPI00399B1DFC